MFNFQYHKGIIKLEFNIFVINLLSAFCTLVHSSTNRMVFIKYVSRKSLIFLQVQNAFFFYNLRHDWIFWIIYSVIFYVVIALYCRSFNQIVYWNFRKVRFIVNVYALLWKRGDILFCTCRSVGRRSLVRSIWLRAATVVTLRK